MPKKYSGMITTEEKPKVITHIHRWISKYDHSSAGCECGMIKVSQSEFERRIEEWNSYRELVKTTPSYLNYQAMKEAFCSVPRNMKKVKELQKEAKEIIAKDDYLPKPNFPDPTFYSQYYYSEDQNG